MSKDEEVKLKKEEVSLIIDAIDIEPIVEDPLYKFNEVVEARSRELWDQALSKIGLTPQNERNFLWGIVVVIPILLIVLDRFLFGGDFLLLIYMSILTLVILLLAGIVPTLWAAWEERHFHKVAIIMIEKLVGIVAKGCIVGFAYSFTADEFIDVIYMRLNIFGKYYSEDQKIKAILCWISFIIIFSLFYYYSKKFIYYLTVRFELIKQSMLKHELAPQALSILVSGALVYILNKTYPIFQNIHMIVIRLVFLFTIGFLVVTVQKLILNALITFHKKWGEVHRFVIVLCCIAFATLLIVLKIEAKIECESSKTSIEATLEAVADKDQAKIEQEAKEKKVANDRQFEMRTLHLDAACMYVVTSILLFAFMMDGYGISKRYATKWGPLLDLKKKLTEELDAKNTNA